MSFHSCINQIKYLLEAVVLLVHCLCGLDCYHLLYLYIYIYMLFYTLYTFNLSFVLCEIIFDSVVQGDDELFFWLFILSYPVLLVGGSYLNRLFKSYYPWSFNLKFEGDFFEQVYVWPLCFLCSFFLQPILATVPLAVGFHTFVWQRFEWLMMITVLLVYYTAPSSQRAAVSAINLSSRVTTIAVSLRVQRVLMYASISVSANEDTIVFLEYVRWIT